MMSGANRKNGEDRVDVESDGSQVQLSSNYVTSTPNLPKVHWAEAQGEHQLMRRSGSCFRVYTNMISEVVYCGVFSSGSISDFSNDNKW